MFASDVSLSRNPGCMMMHDRGSYKEDLENAAILDGQPVKIL